LNWVVKEYMVQMVFWWR